MTTSVGKRPTRGKMKDLATPVSKNIALETVIKMAKK